MNRPARKAAAVAAVAAAALTAGCGSPARPTERPAAEVRAAGAPFLATSLATTAGTWAVGVMGGSAAAHNNFWQLFTRPAGSTRWKLVTPPGTADNGGLVLAGATGQTLISAFRPSQYLAYTPLTLTRNGGGAWSSAGPLDGALANVPDALAAAPRTGHLLALLTSGTVRLAAPPYATWATLTTERALAATPAGRRCGLSGLTAVTVSPSGIPLLAGTCRHAGTAGIFAHRNGTWQAAAPQLPAALAGHAITVVRLTSTANRIMALLQSGHGPSTTLLAAWSADSGSHWDLSPALRPGASLSSASFGAATTAVVMSGRRAQAIIGPGVAWRALPVLPAGTATLAAGPSGGIDALAVHRTRLTIWHLGAGSTTWHAVQEMKVPIQFGSSG